MLAHPLYQASDKAMILEEETYKKFGYYPSALSLGSRKKILAACDDCGSIRKIERKSYRSLCPSCSRKGLLKGKKHPNWKGGWIKQKCKVCGIDFYTRPSEIKKGWGKFCSQKCKNLAQSKNICGAKHPNWKGGKDKCICLVCGKEFYTPPCWIKRGRGKYCSTECAGIAASKIRVKMKNPNWKGGISFEPYCYKFNEEFKQYIRTKFGNVCFLCGKTEEENGKALSVHHVNYDKACGCAETEEDKKADDKACQFVPLCLSCNSKVNFNRDNWEKYFKNKLQNKLNGWYI